MATDTTCRKSHGPIVIMHIHIHYTCIYQFAHVHVHVHETQCTHKITRVMHKKTYFSLQLNTTVVTTQGEALPLIGKETTVQGIPRSYLVTACSWAHDVAAHSVVHYCRHSFTISCISYDITSFVSVRHYVIWFYSSTLDAVYNHIHNFH